ncbi:MAG: hypothetical protein ACRERD_07555, partial [Candidatus Binatia bacterium]
VDIFGSPVCSDKVALGLDWRSGGQTRGGRLKPRTGTIADDSRGVLNLAMAWTRWWDRRRPWPLGNERLMAFDGCCMGEANNHQTCGVRLKQAFGQL